MSENREIYDITVIGGGPAGLFAAFYAGMRGVSVKIIESLSELGGQPAILYPEKAIYDVAGFPEITAAELTENLIKQLERFEDQTTICLKEEVKTFEKEGDVFIVSSLLPEEWTSLTRSQKNTMSKTLKKIVTENPEKYKINEVLPGKVNQYIVLGQS